MKFNHSQSSQQLVISLMIGLMITVLGQVAALGQAPSAQTPEIQQMLKKMEQLEDEVRALRQQVNSAMLASKAPVAELNAAVNVPIPGAKATGQIEKLKSGSTVDFYGYVMLDSGNNFGTIDPNWFDVMRPTKLPAFPGEFAPNGSVFFGVRQTRFGVKSFTPTPAGDLRTLFEFELFGTGVDVGQTTFRLRHAYGELGHFGAGQTWSPFMDIDVFPNSLEYWGPNGMVFFRNVQARWTPIQGNSNVVIALERPGASADGGVYSGRVELQGVTPQFKWPDLSGHGRFARHWGYVQVGGILRKIAWVDENPDKFNLSGTAIGWGVNVSSNLNFTRKDVGKFQVVYGKAIQNYMNDAPIDIGVQNNFSNPISPIKGVPLPVLGVVSFLDHTWSERFTSSIGYSLVNIDNSNAQAPDDFHQGQYALANVLYHPLKKVTMGGEFQFGRRVDFSSGFNVNDYKMQFSFKYDWNKGFEF